LEIYRIYRIYQIIQFIQFIEFIEFIEKIVKMGCPALGVWVAFFKQPALPGEAPQTKKIQKIKFINKKKKKFKSSAKTYIFIFWGALGQAVHRAV
jgi:hypothetical protein